MEDKGCVYHLCCKETGKGYVGLHSKPTPESRIKDHFRTNDNTLLHNAMKKYGRDAFEVSTLCQVPVSALPNMEAYWAEQLETYMWDSPGGYNMVWCGDKPHTGIPHSAETKQKISESGKGRKLSDETKERMRLANIGRTHTEETKQKLSTLKIGIYPSDETRAKLIESRKGRVFTEETRAKIGLAHLGNTNNLGKTLSEETKEKLREKAIGRLHTEETKEKLRNRVVSEETRDKLRQANLGKQASEETREKLSRASSGRKHTEETKQKMAEAAKRRWSILIQNPWPPASPSASPS